MDSFSPVDWVVIGIMASSALFLIGVTVYRFVFEDTLSSNNSSDIEDERRVIRRERAKASDREQ